MSPYATAQLGTWWNSCLICQSRHRVRTFLNVDRPTNVPRALIHPQSINGCCETLQQPIARGISYGYRVFRTELSRRHLKPQRRKSYVHRKSLSRSTQNADLLLVGAAVAAGIGISGPGLAAEPKSAVNPASHNPSKENMT